MNGFDLSTISGVYVGSTQYSQIYMGSNKLWPAQNTLPYDAEVEYLEATGTQYINTNAYPIYNYGLSGEIKMQRTGNSTGDTAYVGRTTYGGFELYTNSNRGICLWVSKLQGDIYVQTGSGGFDKNVHLVTFNITNNISYLSVDGTQYSGEIAANADAQGYVQLFSHRGYYNAEGRIYYCKLYYNSVLIHDLIPVRVGQVGYMYDKVTGRLFGNSGTGSFVLGPDKQ